jgi:hypothetical protein
MTGAGHRWPHGPSPNPNNTNCKAHASHKVPALFFARREQHDQDVQPVLFYGRPTPWFRGNIVRLAQASGRRNSPDERLMNAKYRILQSKNLTEP